MKPKEIREMYRQGDVMLVQDQIPTSAKPRVNKAKEVILAHGEATGHMHALKRATEFNAGDERYLSLKTPKPLTHQEHTHLPIVPATYRIVQQCEYNEGEIRRVAD